MSTKEKTWMLSMICFAFTVLMALLGVYGRLCIVETNVKHVQQDVAALRRDLRKGQILAER